jgi:hypothetical protein
MIQPKDLAEFRDWHAYEVAMELRPDEIQQLVILSGATEYDFEIAARGWINMPGPKFTLMRDGKPYCIGGFHEVVPGVWQSWMAGTDEGWSKHAKSITRGALWLRENIIDNVPNARRFQTTVLSCRAQATEWYERHLGLKYEGTAKDFAVEGLDIAWYAITRKEHNDGFRG